MRAQIEVLLIGADFKGEIFVTTVQAAANVEARLLLGAYWMKAVVRGVSGCSSLKEMRRALEGEQRKRPKNLIALCWNALARLPDDIEVADIPEPRKLLILEESHESSARLAKDFILSSRFSGAIEAWPHKRIYDPQCGISG
jgi:hypothetical protein